MASQEHHEMVVRVLEAAQLAKREAPAGNDSKAVEILAGLAAKDRIVLNGVRAALFDSAFSSDSVRLIDRIIEWAEREQRKSLH